MSFFTDRNRLRRLLNVVPLLAGLVALSPGTFAPHARAQDQGEKPATPDVDKLIADLGADDYQKRDEAQRKLEGMGRRALPALEKAEKESKDAEVRARAHEAIAAIEKSAPRGEATPREKTDRDRERSEREPSEPRKAPSPEDPLIDPNDLFKDLDKGMPEAMQKMLERIRKQMEEADKEFERDRRRMRPNGPGVRVWQFGARTRTPVEERLGATLDAAQPALRAQLELAPTDGGLVVDELVPSGRAWKAGVQLYDVLVAIDGKPIRTPNDLADLGAKDQKLEVIRKAKKETLAVHGPSRETEGDEKGEKKDPVRKF